MDTVVYESMDTTFVEIIRQVLNDNGIPHAITGGAAIGLASSGQAVKVAVASEHGEKAKELIAQITG